MRISAVEQIRVPRVFVNEGANFEDPGRQAMLLGIAPKCIRPEQDDVISIGNCRFGHKVSHERDDLVPTVLNVEPFQGDIILRVPATKCGIDRRAGRLAA